MADGAKALSDLSGIPREEVLSIWEQVKANNKTLDQCVRHRFPEGAVKIGQRVRCLRCGGETTLGNAAAYVRGFRSEGGDPDLVWPGFFTGEKR